MKSDPVDPNATDWVYFTYENWLRDGESINTHSALAEGGTIVTDSTYIGTMVDKDGVTHNEVYGVQFSVNTGADQVTITHRKSTETTGIVNQARLNIDHSAIIPVTDL